MEILATSTINHDELGMMTASWKLARQTTTTWGKNLSARQPALETMEDFSAALILVIAHPDGNTHPSHDPSRLPGGAGG